MGFLHLQESVLGIKSRVLSEGSWNNQQSISEGEDTELDLSGNFLSSILLEVLMCSDFKSTSSWNNALVFHGVLDGSKSVSDGFLSLGNRVIVWSLNEDGAGEWVFNSINESVLIISKNLFIDVLGESKVLLGNVVNGVQLSSSTGEWDSFSISLLCSSDTNNSVSSKELEGRWVNTLLVDNDEVFVVTFTDLSLEVDNLLDLIVSELSLGGNKLFSLVSVGPEEAGMDFSLLVLEGDVKAEDEAVVEGGWQVGVSTTMIEDKTSNESGLGGHLMLHVHDFNHVQVDLSRWNSILWCGDGLNGINKDFTEWVGNGWVDLGVKGSSGNLDEEVSGDILSNFEFFKESEGLHLGKVHTFDKDSWMDSVSDVSLGLSHDFTDEKDIGGGSITNHIVLGSGGSTNHCGGRMLNLHLMEKDGSVLGELNLTSSSDKHLDGSLWTEVSLEDFLKSLGSVDVDSEGLSFSNDIGISVDELK